MHLASIESMGNTSQARLKMLKHSVAIRKTFGKIQI